jgi:hypothetical protein
MSGEVALTISFNIQAASPTAPMHWRFPDSRVYSATVPLDVARKSDVHGYQLGHGAHLWLAFGRHRDVEVAIGAVWNHSLTLFKMERRAIEFDRDYIRLERHEVRDAANL